MYLRSKDLRLAAVSGRTQDDGVALLDQTSAGDERQESTEAVRKRIWEQ